MAEGEEPVTRKAAKRACKSTTPATPATEAAAKTEDYSDNCNSDTDENPTAKAALHKAAHAAAAKMGDSSDEEETGPAAEEATAKPTDKGSDEDSVDTNNEKAVKPAAIAAKEIESSDDVNSDSDDASSNKTAPAEPMNDDEPQTVVNSDKNEKPAAETAPAKPAPKEAAKTEESSDRDRPNSDEGQHPDGADQAKRHQPDNPKTTSHQLSMCPQQQERSPMSWPK
jgi:hypothetical protein